MPINEWSDSIVIAQLSDEPAFSEELGQLLDRLDNPQASSPNVVVDLKGVTYLNSSNIAQLLRLRKKVLGQDRRLRICSVADPVWSELLITGLDKLFDFTDDVSTSLASLQIEQ